MSGFVLSSGGPDFEFAGLIFFEQPHDQNAVGFSIPRKDATTSSCSLTNSISIHKSISVQTLSARIACAATRSLSLYYACFRQTR